MLHYCWWKLTIGGTIPHFLVYSIYYVQIIVGNMQALHIATITHNYEQNKENIVAVSHRYGAFKCYISAVGGSEPKC